MSRLETSALYFGRVTHRRLRPVAHDLSYAVFSMLLDLDDAGEIAGRLRLFSRNRFNLFSFHDRDHGSGRPDDLAAHIRTTLASAGIDGSGPIALLFYPRILGYAFNPLAVYYCRDGRGALSAIVYEVRNTFGGRHSYIIPTTDESEVVRQTADKRFHVSPFMAMETRYHFRLSPPGEDVAVVIRQSDKDGVLFNAAFNGARVDLTDRNLARAFVAYPLMTLKVIAGIHWEGLKLVLKGLKLKKAPNDPESAFTIVRPETDEAARDAA